MVVSPGKIENRYLGHHKKQQKRAKLNNPASRARTQCRRLHDRPKTNILSRSAKKLSQLKPSAKRSAYMNSRSGYDPGSEYA
jgi:hypothetical protein